MALLQGVNYAKNLGSNNGLFELADKGYNNAEIISASDFFEIPVGSDLVAADEIDFQAIVPKGSRLINVEIYSNEALGGAAELSLGIRENDGEFSGGDDATALISSAVLGGAAGSVELDQYGLKGLKLEDDAQLFATVIAPSVVGGSAKKLHVTVYYINE